MRIKDKNDPLYWPNIPKENLILLSSGSYANARVFRYTKGGVELTIKSFEHCPWWIRLLVARTVARIEYQCLNRLQGLHGVTSRVLLLDRYTVAFSYISGESLRKIYRNRQHLPKRFFIEMEKRVRAMHRRGQVHLDLRNLGNVIHGEDGAPYLIDFQSSLKTNYLPKKLRTVLENFDISGVYKCWKLLCEEPLDPQREQLLHKFTKLRRFWIFKNTRRKIKNFL